jgi:hypothetical protein
MPAYRTYINLHQTQEERRCKYATCICAGLSWKLAHRFRDWPWQKLLAVIDNHERQKRAEQLEMTDYDLLFYEPTLWPMQSDWLVI